MIKIIIGAYQVPKEYIFSFNLRNRKPVTRYKQGIVPPSSFPLLASFWMFLELLVQNGHPFPMTPYRFTYL